MPSALRSLKRSPIAGTATFSRKEYTGKRKGRFKGSAGCLEGEERKSEKALM